ncbi:MAG: CehA/McbA family metallohydrolase [Candidatus Altiarchaeota archaeon]|nr:CehA/McbA family metallohydrolase [Candidatus Altiarchaeota archaeon]
MLFDIHVHSLYSDGAASPEEIMEHAQKLGLRGVAITDHNEVAGALKALKKAPRDFSVIPGIEVSSIEGHILGLGVTELIPRRLSAEETIERIHDAGGIAVAAHPFDRLRQGVGELIYELPFDAVEVFNGHTMLGSRSPEKIMDGLKLPVTGGSDAHLLSELGSVVMDLEGDPLEAIRAGNSQITVNISKPRILFNHIKRKLAKIR